MKLDKREIEAVIATNRFGMGAQPGEIDSARLNPKEWLINSLSNITPPKEAPTSIRMLQAWKQLNHLKKLQKRINEQKSQNLKRPKQLSKEQQEKIKLLAAGNLLKTNSGLIVKESIQSNHSINFRLLDFFSNHFSVSAHSTSLRFLAPTFDWEAIAPNLTGPFSKMLTSAVSHPAMLLYLDNNNNAGPNSLKAKKNSSIGLNENLAREILELHTMGVNSDYTQQDIQELAKAITGWSSIKKSKIVKNSIKQAFLYRENYHEPGDRKILGKVYKEVKGSNQQAISILTDLANHPKTANHICTKLARHFTKDEPDISLIKEMTSTWLKTNGTIKSVMETMILSKSSWQSETLKFKSPREFLISAYRTIPDISKTLENKDYYDNLKHLRQEPYSAGSPDGFGDTKSTWDSSDELFNRIDWCTHFSSRLKQPSSLELLKIALGNSISTNSLKVIQRAESQRQAVSLLLMSPEFLYR